MKHIKSRKLLLAGSALLGLASPAAALAQQAETETAPAPEQATGADAALIGAEIIVTARRREERLQDVPVAISAFSGTALQNQGAIDITSLQQQTPNLTLQIARGSNSTLIAFIRGIGQQDPVWGFEPGVGLYVDDVYVARPQGAVLDIFDIDRVEVLRGPQGTLYGRNTIGGAIKYVTKRLGNDFEAKVRGAYGSYDQRDLIGSVTVPISDILSVGGAVAWYKRDGFGENLTTGAEHYNKDVLAGRLSAELTPSDALFIRIAADKTVDKSNPRHGHRELGNGTALGAPLEDVYDTRAGIGDDNKVVTQGISGTIELEASDALTLKSITAYRKGHTDTVIDFDGLPQPILDIPSFYKDHQFTQEFQALITADRLQGVIGLYYLDNSAEGAFDTVIGNANLTTLTSGQVDTRSYAAFGDISYDLTDHFSVSLGGRYTRDKREGTVFRADYLGLRSPIFGRPTATPFRIRTNYTNDRTDSKFTPRISLRYEPTDDIMAYASYNKGFKSGGFDPRGDAIFTPDTVNGYAPETVDAYEVGLKGAFLDRTFFLNAAGFYSDYKNQQVTTQFVSGTTVVSSVDNAGASRIWGLELEGRAVASPELSVSFAYGYTNAKFREFLTLNPATLRVEDLADSRVFQNTPEHNINVSLNYAKDLGGAGTLALTPSLSYRSDYSLFEVPNRVLDQDGYELVDMSIVWTSDDKRFQIGAHGRNLTDKKYRVGGYNFPGALTGNSIIGFYGPPRTFTVTGEVRF
ncbi:TonB-dependent receptor [Sphingomonas oleivorans]|uniref:TonB-dependent receptor n=1 Tax=Sphingomonas oleivorans TaxID=1735121 RepID=A0A2T5FW37_9SPHN|nr:TonB-dependent receptor [Sphingomonas oleivorans]PTQ09994.1 TonB-dependent receptor [Sphingomonas oleivorans]